MLKENLTVVIPCKNEQQYIALTLDALRREQRDFGVVRDIILVDNNSTDNSVAIAESYGVTVLTCDGTISTVRNVGAARVETDYIAFIDADIEVKPGWSEHIAAIFQGLGDGAQSSIVGYPCNVPDEPSWIEAVWFKSLSRRRHKNYIGAANLITSKALFDALGGFDEKLITGEDLELCTRAKSRGYTLLLDPSLDVIHHGYPKNLRGFYARERWHGIASQDRGGGAFASKAGWLALFTLIYAVLFIAMAAAGYTLVMVLVSLGLALVAIGLCANRLGNFNSLEPVQLFVLFVVYAVARTHSLLDSLFNSGKAREFASRKKLYSSRSG